EVACAPSGWLFAGAAVALPLGPAALFTVCRGSRLFHGLCQVIPTRMILLGQGGGAPEGGQTPRRSGGSDSRRGRVGGVHGGGRGGELGAERVERGAG